MNWGEVLRRVAEAAPACDLSTGDPIELECTTETLRAAMRELAESEELGGLLGAYADLDGMPDFIEDLAARLGRVHGRPVPRLEILVTPGVQAALAYVLEWIRGENRLAVYPAGFDFPGMFGAGRWIPGDPDRDGGVAPEQLEPGSCFLLSRPHNPSGRLWPRRMVEELAASASARGGWLILDETYALPFAPLAVVDPDPVDAPGIVHLYSFSKVGLAGARVGVVHAPEGMIETLRPIQRRFLIQTPKLGQRLARALLASWDRHPERPRRYGLAYQERWSIARAALKGVPVDVQSWEGGPFLWCRWEGAPRSDEVFEVLLQRGVGVAPASAFARGAGFEGLRLGLGAAPETVRAGARVVSEVLVAALSRRPGSTKRPPAANDPGAADRELRSYLRPEAMKLLRDARTEPNGPDSYLAFDFFLELLRTVKFAAKQRSPANSEPPDGEALAACGLALVEPCHARSFTGWVHRVRSEEGTELALKTLDGPTVAGNRALREAAQRWLSTRARAGEIRNDLVSRVGGWLNAVVEIEADLERERRMMERACTRAASVEGVNLVRPAASPTPKGTLLMPWVEGRTVARWDDVPATVRARLARLHRTLTEDARLLRLDTHPSNLRIHPDDTVSVFDWSTVLELGEEANSDLAGLAPLAAAAVARAHGPDGS